MAVKVTREFRAVKPGEVYPSLIKAGETVEGRLEEIAREQGCAGAPLCANEPTAQGQDTPPGAEGNAPATGANSDPPPPATPRVIRAKFTAAYEGPDREGATVKFKKGAIVRDEDAAFFHAAGAAEALDWA